ncbi:MAG: helix-turn-helix transcriptional regulator [Oscillospiraceae bacterium]|nr:helix-turn-helix transcriptional regulator [Oscillospiraceae bacterium]
MDRYSIGKNLRQCRLAKKMRQEDLAEKTNLSPNYIGMIERGEKLPALDTFIDILNALDASADVVLADVLNARYDIKTSLISEKVQKLSSKEQKTVLDIVDAVIKNF